MTRPRLTPLAWMKDSTDPWVEASHKRPEGGEASEDETNLSTSSGPTVDDLNESYWLKQRFSNEELDGISGETFVSMMEDILEESDVTQVAPVEVDDGTGLSILLDPSGSNFGPCDVGVYDGEMKRESKAQTETVVSLLDLASPQDASHSASMDGIHLEEEPVTVEERSEEDVRRLVLASLLPSYSDLSTSWDDQDLCDEVNSSNEGNSSEEETSSWKEANSCCSSNEVNSSSEEQSADNPAILIETRSNLLEPPSPEVSISDEFSHSEVHQDSSNDLDPLCDSSHSHSNDLDLSDSMNQNYHNEVVPPLNEVDCASNVYQTHSITDLDDLDDYYNGRPLSSKDLESSVWVELDHPSFSQGQPTTDFDPDLNCSDREYSSQDLNRSSYDQDPRFEDQNRSSKGPVSSSSIALDSPLGDLDRVYNDQDALSTSQDTSNHQDQTSDAQVRTDESVVLPIHEVQSVPLTTPPPAISTFIGSPATQDSISSQIIPDARCPLVTSTSDCSSREAMLVHEIQPGSPAPAPAPVPQSLQVGCQSSSHEEVSQNLHPSPPEAPPQDSFLQYSPAQEESETPSRPQAMEASQRVSQTSSYGCRFSCQETPQEPASPHSLKASQCQEVPQLSSQELPQSPPPSPRQLVEASSNLNFPSSQPTSTEGTQTSQFAPTGIPPADASQASQESQESTRDPPHEEPSHQEGADPSRNQATHLWNETTQPASRESTLYSSQKSTEVSLNHTHESEVAALHFEEQVQQPARILPSEKNQSFDEGNTFSIPRSDGTRHGCTISVIEAGSGYSCADQTLPQLRFPQADLPPIQEALLAITIEDGPKDTPHAVYEVSPAEDKHSFQDQTRVQKSSQSEVHLPSLQDVPSSPSNITVPPPQRRLKAGKKRGIKPSPSQDFFHSRPLPFGLPFRPASRETFPCQVVRPIELIASDWQTSPLVLSPSTPTPPLSARIITVGKANSSAEESLREGRYVGGIKLEEWKCVLWIPSFFSDAMSVFTFVFLLFFACWMGFLLRTL